MKRLALVIMFVLVCAVPTWATTFDFMPLTNWAANIQWSTSGAPGNRPLLGVSTTPGGALFGLDSSGRLDPLLSEGNVYYLYGGNLAALPEGTDVSIDIYTDYAGQGGVSPKVYAGFDVVGTPGTFQLWTINKDWYFGSTGGIPSVELYLGWAQGTADKVSPGAFAPDGSSDLYLVLGIGVMPQPPDVPQPPAVPLPGAIWLLGAGIVGLLGFRKV